MTFSFFIHAALIALSLCSSVPQIVRLVRVRDRSGLSPAHATGAIAQGSLWVLHSTAGVPGVLWLVVAIQSLFAAAAVVELALLIRLRAPVRAALWSGAALAAAGGALVLAAGPVGWGLAGIAGSWWKFGPPVAAAYRSADPRGVSWPTWAMIAVRGVGFMAYGAIHADWVIMVGSLTPATAGALILARVAATRRGGADGRSGLPEAPHPIWSASSARQSETRPAGLPEERAA